jgi:hypothetical protein
MDKYPNIKFYVETHYASNIFWSVESSSERNHINQLCMKLELRKISLSIYDVSWYIKIQNRNQKLNDILYVAVLIYLTMFDIHITMICISNNVWYI